MLRSDLTQVKKLINVFLEKIGDNGGITQFDFERRESPSSCDTDVVVQIHYGQKGRRSELVRKAGEQLLAELRGCLPNHSVALRLLPVEDVIFLQ